MKITHHEVKAVSNQTESKVIPMTIGDSKIIADLLRKHYQNPRRTMIQEYLSNARDAHREIKQTKNIKVTLPTNSSPLLIIRDYGPGLSEERLVNYFCSYAASTKRDNDEQTGGFGLGTKIAWAYRDNFFINNYFNGIKTSYDANVAVSYEGGLKELSVKESSEDNGVEIIIPIFPKDIKLVAEDYAQITHFWSNLEVVNFKEDEMQSPKPLVVFEDENCIIMKSPRSEYYHAEAHTWVLLDSIPYPLPVGSLNDLDEDLPNNFRRQGHYIALKFKSGELKPTIAREQLEASDSNLKGLTNKFLATIQGVIKLEQQLLADIGESEDLEVLSEKSSKYSQVFRTEGFADFKLGSVNLRDGRFKFVCPVTGPVKFIRYNAGDCGFSKKRKTELVDFSLNFSFYVKGENLQNVSEKDVVVSSKGVYVLAQVQALQADYFSKLNKFLKFKSSDELDVKICGVQVDDPQKEFECQYLVTTENVGEWKTKLYKASKVAKHMFVTEELKTFSMEVLIPLARQQKLSLLVIPPEDFLPNKERMGVNQFFVAEKMKEVLENTLKSKVSSLSRIIKFYQNYEFFESTPLIKEMATHPVFTLAAYEYNEEEHLYHLPPAPCLSPLFLDLMKKHSPESVQLVNEVHEWEKRIHKFFEENSPHQAFHELITRRWGIGLHPGPETLALIRLAVNLKSDKK